MNYAKINPVEYTNRVENLRKIMAKDGVDLVMGYSNLVELGIVRYYCGFAPVNENSAIIIPKEGAVTVCAGQAGFDYAEVQNQLKGSIIKIFPEVGEVSGFEYDTEGQLDFAEYFKSFFFGWFNNVNFLKTACECLVFQNEFFVFIVGGRSYATESAA